MLAGERDQAGQDHLLERLNVELSVLSELKDAVLEQASLGADCAVGVLGWSATARSDRLNALALPWQQQTEDIERRPFAPTLISHGIHEWCQPPVQSPLPRRRLHPSA
jgi:hypothetical protein